MREVGVVLDKAGEVIVSAFSQFHVCLRGERSPCLKITDQAVFARFASSIRVARAKKTHR